MTLVDTTAELAAAGHRTKTFAPAEFKAVGEGSPFGGTLKDGEFVAVASVIGNVDRYGDRVNAGAFDDTLAAWKASGDPIPVIWMHMWSNPDAHIGAVDAIEADDTRLVYKGIVDLDNPFAAQVYRLMKARRVTQQSFGYDVLEAAESVVDGDWVWDLKKLDLFEVGPCLQGVNPETDLLDIKSRSLALPKRLVREHTGQTRPAAADASKSTPPPASTPTEPDPASVPAPDDDPAPASKGLSPASVLLATDVLEMEGTLDDD